MPRLGRQTELVEAETLLDPASRYRDLAIRLRMLNPDGSLGELRPEVIGGRWDNWTQRWVFPQPRDLTAVEFTVQPQQLPIILALGQEAALRMVAIFAGVQAGKTNVGLTEIAFGAVRYPGRESYVISLDYKASREPQESFAALLPPEWGVDWIATDRWFLFPNSHRVIFRSEKNIKSIRGGAPLQLLIDEAAYMQEASYIAAIGRGVASKDFRLILTTTPVREREWIRRVDETWGKDSASRVFRLRSDDNPRSNKDHLTWLRANMPADVVEQELEGIIAPPLDAAYASVFRRGLHIRPPGQLPEAVRFGLERQPKDFTAAFCQREYDADADFIGGWDFIKEATVIGKLFRDTRIVADSKGNKRRKATLRLWIYGASFNPHTSTDQHAQAMRERWGRRVAWITDAMGQHPGAGGRGQADRSAHEILREHGFAYVEPVAAANPEVVDRQRTLRRALRSGLEYPGWDYADKRGVFKGGEVLIFIVPAGVEVEVQQENGKTTKVVTDGCPQLVDALENQKMKDGKPAKDKKHEHLNDATGYLVYGVLPIDSGPVEGFEYPNRQDEPADFEIED